MRNKRLAQALLLSDMEPAALALIQQALPPWLDPAQTAPRARLLACRLLVSAGAWKLAEALLGRAVLATPDVLEGADAAAELSILRTETELLSHELALALDHNSLTPPSEDPDSDRWRSLSRAQLGQDLWVLERTNRQSHGFLSNLVRRMGFCSATPGSLKSTLVGVEPAASRILLCLPSSSRIVNAR